jgi:hypothetical protein
VKQKNDRNVSELHWYSVLRIRDVYPGSRILIFAVLRSCDVYPGYRVPDPTFSIPDPVSRIRTVSIPDPGYRILIKEFLSILTPKKTKYGF